MLMQVKPAVQKIRNTLEETKQWIVPNEDFLRYYRPM